MLLLAVIIPHPEGQFGDGAHPKHYNEGKAHEQGGADAGTPAGRSLVSRQLLRGPERRTPAARVH